MQHLIRALVKEVLESEMQERASKKKKKQSSVEGDVGRPRSDPNTAFARWLDRQIGGTEKAADTLDLSVSHVNKLARNDADPSLDVALDIEKKTNGDVSVDSWLSK